MTTHGIHAHPWVLEPGHDEPGAVHAHIPLVPFHWHPHLRHHDHATTAVRSVPFVRVDGLDGLRGLAVVAVLIFHVWPTLLPGGFIGVTLFFALSGFLITSILLHELEGTGSISLRRFYGRRFRRLVPVSLATLTAVTVGWTMAGWLTHDLRRELLFSLGQSANWGQILAAQRYGVDGAASPVLHFWSLAIEEQLYLLLPLALLLCRTRRRGQVAVGLALAGSVVAVVLAAGNPSLAYYSSFTRGGEVLVGSLVALTLHGRKWSSAGGRTSAFAVAFGGFAVLAWTARRTSVTDPWYSHGGLLVSAGVSVAIIAAVAGWPALGRRIDWWPLARLGQISYAVYLFHWPLLQAFRRSSLDPALVPWATLWATILLALLSERWFERPIRAGTVPGPRLVAVGACAILFVPMVASVGLTPTSRENDFEAAAQQLDAMIAAEVPSSVAPAAVVAVVHNSSVVRAEASRALADSEGAAAPVATEPTSPPSPVRVGFFGDSKALVLGLGAFNRGFPEIQVGTSFTALGCPTGRGGDVRNGKGAAIYPTTADCDWERGIPSATAASGGLDVAVVWSGTWDLMDRRVPALGRRWTDVDDPAYRQWLLGEMTALNDTIVADTGARRVLWLTVTDDPQSKHPERSVVWNELLQELEVVRSGTVSVVDVAGYVANSGEASRLLPDGVHPSHGADDPAVNSGAELTQALILPVVTAAHA